MPNINRCGLTKYKPWRRWYSSWQHRLVSSVDACNSLQRRRSWEAQHNVWWRPTGRAEHEAANRLPVCVASTRARSDVRKLTAASATGAADMLVSLCCCSDVHRLYELARRADGGSCTGSRSRRSGGGSGNSCCRCSCCMLGVTFCGGARTGVSCGAYAYGVIRAITGESGSHRRMPKLPFSQPAFNAPFTVHPQHENHLVDHSVYRNMRPQFASQTINSWSVANRWSRRVCLLWRCICFFCFVFLYFDWRVWSYKSSDV